MMVREEGFNFSAAASQIGAPHGAALDEHDEQTEHDNPEFRRALQHARVAPATAVTASTIRDPPGLGENGRNAQPA